jgi:iron only hydrogenase large subunit-like protein
MEPDGAEKTPQYSHSVTLDVAKCRGCTNCIKRCPTEAIRVRKGHAAITEYRCIDCGECIRNCPYGAKKAVTDPLALIREYDWKVALPAPALYGQFDEFRSIDQILSGLLAMGFDQVFEVPLAAELVADAVKDKIERMRSTRPVISSSCPAVLHLIQIRYPSLLPHVAPVIAPMELAGRMARQAAGTGKGRVGVFFISPCAAKMTDVRSPVGVEKSSVDGVIAIKDIFLPLRQAMAKVEIQPLSRAGSRGVAWARVDGESESVGERMRISVDGIVNVIQVLEAVENGTLNNTAFIEAMACPGGCVGGPLTVDNPFVAKTRIRNREERLKPRHDPECIATPFKWTNLDWSVPFEARGDLMLSGDRNRALEMEAEMEDIEASLPGLDCGSCGAPTCRALAEDIVKGNANVNACVFKLRESVRKLAAEMIELEQINPPSLDRD